MEKTRKRTQRHSFNFICPKLCLLIIISGTIILMTQMIDLIGTRTELRLPFDLQYFNKITKGGVYQKTLNVCLAGTGVGKSLFMCH